MTDEQIKQNAKNFAINETGGLAIKYFPCEKGYIAGAHSRDEEIDDLEFRLRDKKADIQFLESCIAELRNPWIKPSEQMPVDGDDIVYLLYEGKAGRMKYHSTYEKWLRESVTHWMKVTLKEEM